MIRFQMTPEEYVNGIDATIIPDDKVQSIIKTCTLGGNTAEEEQQNDKEE